MPLNHTTSEQEFQVPSAAKLRAAFAVRKSHERDVRVLTSFVIIRVSLAPNPLADHRAALPSLVPRARIRSILVTIGEHSHYLTARCIFC